MSQLNVDTIGSQTGTEVSINSGHYIHQAGIPIQVVTYSDVITAANTITSTSYTYIEHILYVSVTRLVGLCATTAYHYTTQPPHATPKFPRIFLYLMSYINVCFKYSVQTNSRVTF